MYESGGYPSVLPLTYQVYVVRVVYQENPIFKEFFQLFLLKLVDGVSKAIFR